MTVWLPVLCPDCRSDEIIKHGKSPERKQRYVCRNTDCLRCTFVLNPEQPGRQREVKQKIVDMAVNGSGVPRTARVLHVRKRDSNQRIQKKSPQLEVVNQRLLQTIQPELVEVEIRLWKKNREGLQNLN